MMGRREDEDDALATQAAAWVVRLAGEDCGEADGLAFAAWLDAGSAQDSERRRKAFDRAQATWLQFEALELEGPASAAGASAAPPVRKPAVRRAAALAAASAATVAVVGLAAALVLRVGASHAPSAAGVEAVAQFVTAPGQRLTLRLGDGSRVEMDGATRLAVASGEGRKVAIERGEAAFDIVHDPMRPFTVSAGALRVRVLGTAFDVERDGDATSVAVARGAVSASTGIQEVRVAAGQAARVTPAGDLAVTRVPIADVGSWRQDRRLYLDRPLSEVVADLNRRYPAPIRLSGEGALGMRFTGVLVVGPDRARTLRRLTALLPLTARAGRGGSTVLTSLSH